MSNLQPLFPHVYSLTNDSEPYSLSHNSFGTVHIQRPSPRIPTFLYQPFFLCIRKMICGRVELIQLPQTLPPPPEGTQHKPLRIMLSRKMGAVGLPPFCPCIFLELGLSILADGLHSRTHRSTPICVPLLLDPYFPQLECSFESPPVGQPRYPLIELITRRSSLTPTVQREPKDQIVARLGNLFMSCLLRLCERTITQLEKGKHTIIHWYPCFQTSQQRSSSLSSRNLSASL